MKIAVRAVGRGEGGGGVCSSHGAISFPHSNLGPTLLALGQVVLESINMMLEAVPPIDFSTTLAPIAKTWRSTRHGHMPWDFALVDATANDIIAEIPASALELISMNKFLGTALVTLPRGNVIIPMMGP
jgi:hypothetical protein